MPSSDYSNAVSGGLKLKGAKDAGVKKKHKKKKADKPTASDDVKGDGDGDSTTVQKALAEEDGDEKALVKEQEEEVKALGKTEAQIRHEERRRKRLDERLKREGIKTHKERVEELNKYLSGLSEHHDMPRIGPG